MVLENLASSLRTTLKKIATAPYVDSNLIKDVVRDIQRALLQSDINVKLVLKLTKRIEERALTEKPPAGMSSKNHVIKIVYEELVNILGKGRDIPLKKQIIMLVGLYGQGKTTTAGKLARYFQKKGMSVAMISGDVHRPAAYDQLVQLGEKIGVFVYGELGEKRAAKIVREGIEKLKNYDIIIVDTSGRHSLEDDLIDEMKRIANVAKPDEKFLVLDATIGQTAGSQAKAFHDAIQITGVIITKMDGTAKGGGALSAVQATKAPVVFIGTGEHIDELEKFDPPRFISRLLGMGDIKALVERAEGVIDEKKAEDVAKKMMTGKFTLKDLYEQMDMLSGMGPLRKIIDLLPSQFTGKVSKGQMDMTQEQIRKYKVIMDSMTEEELLNPKIIKSSRIRRIAIGSGCETADVRALLKYYNRTRKMIKGITSNRKMRRALMKQFENLDM